MELLLIRHAQSAGNETGIVQGQIDTGLSELGKTQANILSNYFQAGDLNAIYSSPLDRAYKTAIPTSKKLNLKIKQDVDLQEASFGIWEGMTYEEVSKKYSNEYTSWHKNYFVRPLWFESFELHLTRVKSAIKKILRAHSLNERIAIFSHGGSIKTQIGFFKNLTGEELANFSLTNCSLTLISFNHSGKYEDGKLIYYNKEVI